MPKAFRLEILVLVAVLAILVLPAVITAAQERADSLRECKTNLKQLGLAFAMYMLDYNEVMPPSLQILADDGYAIINEEYNCFVCPVAPPTVPFDPKAIDATTDYYYARVKSPVDVETPGSVPIAWDRVVSHPDGVVAVVYLDFHVASVKAVDFEKAISKLTALYLKPPVLPVPPPAVETEKAEPSPDE